MGKARSRKAFCLTKITSSHSDGRMETASDGGNEVEEGSSEGGARVEHSFGGVEPALYHSDMITNVYKVDDIKTFVKINTKNRQ